VRAKLSQRGVSPHIFSPTSIPSKRGLLLALLPILMCRCKVTCGARLESAQPRVLLLTRSPALTALAPATRQTRSPPSRPAPRPTQLPPPRANGRHTQRARYPTSPPPAFPFFDGHRFRFSFFNSPFTQLSVGTAACILTRACCLRKYHLLGYHLSFLSSSFPLSLSSLNCPDWAEANNPLPDGRAYKSLEY
jgi:hypothetical protein